MEILCLDEDRINTRLKTFVVYFSENINISQVVNIY